MKWHYKPGYNAQGTVHGSVNGDQKDMADYIHITYLTISLC